MSMGMKEFLEGKIAEFEKNHFYKGYLSSTDPEIKRRWKEEEKIRDRKWCEIKSNKDVYDLIDQFDGAVSIVEKFVWPGHGHIEDGFNMSLALYNAIRGLKKLAQFVDRHSGSADGFSEITEQEVDKIFSRLEEIYVRMEEMNMRRAMQD